MEYVQLKDLMANLEEDALMSAMNEIMDAGGKGVTEAMEACQAGLEVVGNKFEAGEYFVGDLIYAGEIMTAVMEIIAPALKAGGTGSSGKMILCTVKGDLHDIGKNIVRAMLEASGMEVTDLGIDVPPELILKTAKEQDIHIVALSGVLTLALNSMKKTVEAFAQAGMREKVKILIGGNPVSERACEAIGADAWSQNPQRGVQICKEWSGT